MSAAVSNVSVNDFTAEVVNAAVPVVVDFWAPWCGPCRMVAPEMEKVATRMGEGAKVVKVNVDENGALAAQFGVMSIPTIIIMHGGKEVARQVGFLPADSLVQFLEQQVLAAGNKR